MKTIKEWLETLPEPYRSQALKNGIDMGKERSSLFKAINSAFVWSNSKEGFDYWRMVANIDPDKLIPKKSNRELAEMIWNELMVPGNDGEGYTLTIETILDKHR
jgi:hypothetical protein